MKLTQNLLLGLLALSCATLAAACSDNNLATVDEPSISVEQPTSGAITIELPEQPNRPRRQSQSIILRSTGDAPLVVSEIAWIAQPQGLHLRKSQAEVADCAVCNQDICLASAAGGVCVETGIPELPITIPAGQAVSLELYVEKDTIELDCPTPGADVPEVIRPNYCGALRIKTNARNSDLVVNEGEATIYMTNSGKSGQIRLSETYLEFTGVTPGFTATRSFAIENNGSSPLQIDNLILSNNANFFTIGGDVGVEIPAGQSRPYSIQLNIPEGTSPDALNFTTNLDILSSAANATTGKIIISVKTSQGDVPQISVDASSLRFDQSAEQTFNIENTGNATLLVNSVSFQPASIRKFYTLTVDEQPFGNLSIQKASTSDPERNKKQVKIAFNRPSGTDGESAAGTMIINHNDESSGKETRVIVLGDAGDVPLGDLRPYSFTFDLNNTASQQRSFAIFNYGSSPLNITGIMPPNALTGTADEFQINLTTPAVVPAGGVLEASVLFKAENSTPDNVTFTLTTDSSGEALIMNLISVNDGGQPPVAKIKSSFAGDAKVGERASFDATGSEPSNAASSAQWVLISKPAGSNALINNIGATTGFTPDVAGDYKVSLTVTNGTSDSQEVLSFKAQ